MTTRRSPGKKTIADWLAQPEALRLELIDGDLIEKAAPDVKHSISHAGLDRLLGPIFDRRGGGGFPGGWWIHIEVDIQLGENGYRPDLSGWRRDRVPVMPRERPSETLNVYRLEAPGYLHVLTAERHERVRAEPFDAIELRVGLLFGDDPAD